MNVLVSLFVNLKRVSNLDVALKAPGQLSLLNVLFGGNKTGPPKHIFTNGQKTLQNRSLAISIKQE